MDAYRCYHCTFYKCGSQWIRDVLSDPALLLHTDCRLAHQGIDVPSVGLPELAAGELASPLYTVGRVEALRPTDSRWLVVVRDPRDMIVSLVRSLSWSHAPNDLTAILRLPLQHAQPEDRIRIGIHLFTHWAPYFRSWFSGELGEDQLRLDYADLIGDEQREFRRIFAFFGWRVPDEVATEVIARHSFVATSGGRRPGDENEFSHRRKGVSGDWRNHFSRETAALFESACPGLLREAGYEASDDWWAQLPEREASAGDEPGELRRLHRALEAQESEIQILRGSAEERLRDLETLNRYCLDQQREWETERQLLLQASAERLRDLGTLHELYQALRDEAATYREAAEERLVLARRLDRELAEIHRLRWWGKLLRLCGLPH